MKIFLLILFYFFSLYSKELRLNDFEAVRASPYMVYFHDINDTYDPLKQTPDVWKLLKSPNLGSAKMYPSWTRFELLNDTNAAKTIILKNPRAGMDEIDVYIIRKKTYQLHFLGDARPLANRNIVHWNSVFSLRLEPHENVQIITRLVNRIGSTEGEWVIFSEKSFYYNSIFEALWWGVFAGFILALLAYVIPTLVATKDRYITLFFVLYVVASLLYQYSVNGLIYLLGFPPSWMNHFVLFSAISFGAFSILLILRFLYFEKHYGVIFWAASIFGVFLGCEYLLLLISIFVPKLMDFIGLTNVYVGLLAYIIWFTMLRELIRITKDPVFRYFFLGYTIVIFAYALQALVSAGFMEMNPITIYSVSVATLIEVFFFMKAISEYIRVLENDKKRKAKLIDFQIRFASIGKVIGNIAHQWKVPLVRFGALITQIETTLYFKKEVLSEELLLIIPQFRSNLSFMQNTVDEFYQLYSSQNKAEIFSPNTLVKEIWAMLHAKALRLNAKISIDTEEDTRVRSYPHLFSHVIMILMDNTLDIAKDRKIKSPMIFVNIFSENEWIRIVFEDTCGGITQNPIESIFDIDISSKNYEEKPGGMGLAMAKMIVEDKLKGSVLVENSGQGAKFTFLFRSL